ncbi:hypothetical protein HK405_014689, partial [Cladochytrium tenue]
AYNATPLDVTPLAPAGGWSATDLARGAARAAAVALAPYDRVLLLDADVVPLRDATELFSALDRDDSSNGRSPAAVLWPGPRQRTRAGPLWAVFGLNARTCCLPELETDAAAALVDKRRAAVAVALAASLAADAAEFYLSHTNDLLYWALRATSTPFHQPLGFPDLVGVLVNAFHTMGGAPLPPDGGGSLPRGSRFCGVARVLRAPGINGGTGGAPVLLHATGLKHTFHLESPALAVGMAYAGPTSSDAGAGRVAGVGVTVTPTLFKMAQCAELTAVTGLDVRVWDWEQENPGNSDAYRVAHGVGFASDQEYKSPAGRAADLAGQRAKWQTYLAQVEDYDAKLHGGGIGGNSNGSAPPTTTRGVVMTGGKDSINNAVMAALFLREVGCRLPITFAHMRAQVTDVMLDKLRAFNITPFDISAAVQPFDWTEREIILGGPKATAIL